MKTTTDMKFLQNRLNELLEVETDNSSDYDEGYKSGLLAALEIVDNLVDDEAYKAKKKGNK